MFSTTLILRSLDVVAVIKSADIAMVNARGIDASGKPLRIRQSFVIMEPSHGHANRTAIVTAS
jgi:hypothetical protein